MAWSMKTDKEKQLIGILVDQWFVMSNDEKEQIKDNHLDFYLAIEHLCGHIELQQSKS